MQKSTGKPKERQVKAIVIKKGRQAPGATIQSRENQITRLAYDLVEEKIRKKTATSQELVHFLKMGSAMAQLEKEKLEKENQLLIAKTESLQSQKHIEELYAKAMAAFSTYSGKEQPQDDEED